MSIDEKLLKNSHTLIIILCNVLSIMIFGLAGVHIATSNAASSVSGPPSFNATWVSVSN
jgi:hypothetical protein